MIKFNVEVCAVISSTAELKKAKDGNEFLSFGIMLTVRGRDGAQKDLPISVSVDGGKGDLGVYSKDKRVNITGTINVRKRDGVCYYNLRADKVDVAPSTEPDKIEGTMEFQGKIGRKGIDCHTDKKGNAYKAFSAFSSEKVGDNYESTWVRFLYFNPKEGEDFLKTDAYVKCSGDLRLSVFRDAVTLECLLKDVEPWVLDNGKK